MKAARLVVLGIALVAGGGAAFPVAGDDAPKDDAPKKVEAPAPVVQQLPTVEVLIAKGGAEQITSETILTNVRVLAIDQAVEEKNGQRVVVGKTATLEASPRQAETLALSRQSGGLSLALRSLLDANNSMPPPDEGGRRTGINTVRFGVTTMAPK